MFKTIRAINKNIDVYIFTFNFRLRQLQTRLFFQAKYRIWNSINNVTARKSDLKTQSTLQFNRASVLQIAILKENSGPWQEYNQKYQEHIE